MSLIDRSIANPYRRGLGVKRTRNCSADRSRVGAFRGERREQGHYSPFREPEAAVVLLATFQCPLSDRLHQDRGHGAVGDSFEWCGADPIRKRVERSNQPIALAPDGVVHLVRVEGRHCAGTPSTPQR